MTATIDEEKMFPGTRKLLTILRAHPSRKHAISMARLYELWSGEKLPRDNKGRLTCDVATLSRNMRKLIDDLRDVYGIPVMSSSGAGYWIVTNKKELESVRHEFISRGLKSLATAARLASNSLVDEVAQLSLDLSSASSSRFKSVAKRMAPKHQVDSVDTNFTLSREARLAVVTRYLQDIFDDPDNYHQQIRSLQQQFGARLVPAFVMKELIKKVKESREGATFVMAKLDEMLASMDSPE